MRIRHLIFAAAVALVPLVAATGCGNATSAASQDRPAADTGGDVSAPKDAGGGYDALCKISLARAKEVQRAVNSHDANFFSPQESVKQWTRLANVAPPELKDDLTFLAETYGKVTSGQVNAADVIEKINSAVKRVNAAAKQHCGFAIAGEPK